MNTHPKSDSRRKSQSNRKRWRIAWSLSATGIVATIVGTAFAAGGESDPVGLATTAFPKLIDGAGAPNLDDYLYIRAGLPPSVETAPAELEALMPPEPPPPPPLVLPEPVTGHWPGDEKWARLRMCESTEDPRAVSPDGWYRGLYQFDMRTWRSVGGSGDPIDASRDEQTLRALLLYAERGATPWPVCGRYLY